MTGNPDAWKQYVGDFDAMSDEEVEQELGRALNEIDEQESWVEAVASWKAAGKPRTKKGEADG